MDQTAIVVAAFGCVGLIGAATLPVLLSRSSRRAVHEVHAALGQNGKPLHNRIDEIISRDTAWKARASAVLDNLTEWQINHDRQARARDAAIAELVRRLDADRS